MVTSGGCVLSLATNVTVTVSPTMVKAVLALLDTIETDVNVGGVLSKVTTLPSVASVVCAPALPARSR